MRMSREESGRLGGLAKAAHVGPIINTCQECHKEFTPTQRGVGGRKQGFCSRSCALRWQHREGSRKDWTWQKRGLEATESPTDLNVAWAAGVYEGEGWCAKPVSSLGVYVGQKDRWLLERLTTLFGGSITSREFKPGHISQFPNRNYATQFIWHIHGGRAKRFLMAIYEFLSPRRQEQVRKVFPTISLEQT